MVIYHRSNSIPFETLLKDEGLGNFCICTALTTDQNTGDMAVASMEARDYTFLRHLTPPGKGAPNLSDLPNLNHSWNSINANRYFADRLIVLDLLNTNSKVAHSLNNEHQASSLQNT